MSKFVSGLLGAAALLVTVGAAQLAVGQNLFDGTAFSSAAVSSQAAMVNRAVKGDQTAAPAVKGDTSFVTHVRVVEGSSVAVRMQRQIERRPAKTDTASSKSAKRPVACEAPASVLTEVARSMESARCVT